MPQFLLNAPPSELTPRLEALPAALGVTREEGMALVHEHPGLLLLPTASMAASWRELRRAASMRAEWREQMGGWCVSTLHRCVRTWWAASDVGPCVVASALVWCAEHSMLRMHWRLAMSNKLWRRMQSG
jgi:hypothetical protein